MMWHHPIGVPETPHLAIREEDWKLLINLDSGGVELYDLANDVRESKNLANEEPDVVAKLKAELLKWYKSIPHSHIESRR